MISFPLLAPEDSSNPLPSPPPGPTEGQSARLAVLAGVDRGWVNPADRLAEGRREGESERSSPRASRQNTRLSRNLETQGSRCHLRVTSSETPVIKCFFPAPSPGCGSPPFYSAGRIKSGEKIHNCALHSQSMSILVSQSTSTRGVLRPPYTTPRRGLRATCLSFHSPQLKSRSLMGRRHTLLKPTGPHL